MFDPNMLNSDPDALIAWFDDLGTGNEAYSFLSNFHEDEPITLPGFTWEVVFSDMHIRHQNRLINRYFDGEMPVGPIGFKTGEHAFAAIKCWGTNIRQFIQIVLADDPNEAKALGRACDLRPDWELIKFDVMMAVQRFKYLLDRKEGRALLETGDALLIEGTLWADDIWGVDLNDTNDPTTSNGANWLGTMIMARRAELLAEKRFNIRTTAGFKNAVSAISGWQKPAWMNG